MRVLDAGCGSGEALAWLADAIGPDGLAVGVDLSRAHVTHAHSRAPINASVVQADVFRPPLKDKQFDLIWCVNTLNHTGERESAARQLGALLKAKGRLAVGQSSFLPDMYFAWDERLEYRTNEAVRAYYRDRYGLSENSTVGIRALVGTLRSAGFREVSASTIAIERIAPLATSDLDYLYEAIFRDTWGERLRGYLSAPDFQQLAELCDPRSSKFALSRPDFHFLQTFTLVVGFMGR
jgi:SAM-dependent methyltransferase